MNIAYILTDVKRRAITEPPPTLGRAAEETFPKAPENRSGAGDDAAFARFFAAGRVCQPSGRFALQLNRTRQFELLKLRRGSVDKSVLGRVCQDSKTDVLFTRLRLEPTLSVHEQDDVKSKSSIPPNQKKEVRPTEQSTPGDLIRLPMR